MRRGGSINVNIYSSTVITTIGASYYIWSVKCLIEERKALVSLMEMDIPSLLVTPNSRFKPDNDTLINQPGNIQMVLHEEGRYRGRISQLQGQDFRSLSGIQNIRSMTFLSFEGESTAGSMLEGCPGPRNWLVERADNSSGSFSAL